MSKESSQQSLNAHWAVWLLPIIAIIVTSVLFINFYVETGKRITITVDDSSGIEVEKTKVRFRGLKIGSVKEIELAADKKDVIIHILLDEGFESFAVTGSRFSLIKPEVNLQGITGLKTLIEGQYIVVLPGVKEGKEKVEFKLQSPVTTNTLDDTSTYILQTTDAESMSMGDSISFRGIKVGSVTKLSLGEGSSSVFIQISIENNYSYLIRENTVFWSKIGVSAKLGLFNTDIKVNSLDSVLNGGIEFSTPTKAEAMAKNFSKFKIAPAPPEGYEKWSPKLQ